LQRVADGIVTDRPNPLGQGPAAALGFDLQQTGYLHGRPQEDRIKHLFPGMPRRVAAFRQRADLARKIKHLVEISLELVSGQALLAFLAFEESPQIDTADGGSGGIKTIAHGDLLAYLLDEFGRHIEGFVLALDEDGDLILRVQVLAIGAVAGGLAAGALAFDKGAGQHIAQRTKAANEPAAQFEVGIARHTV
jgi:hypothetical protein